MMVQLNYISLEVKLLSENDCIFDITKNNLLNNGGQTKWNLHFRGDI